AYNGPLA
uniref:Myotropic neuropeptide 1 n=1 Tax=Leptinotarsa decemlineata TaxID=7539 RepID=MNP1_LEPDE|nr:RecName: Full=Myotropic neuropeptide 1; AltName: Full=Led-MNP-I [Leptinotarsa decemlineata]